MNTIGRDTEPSPSGRGQGEGLPNPQLRRVPSLRFSSAAIFIAIAVAFLIGWTAAPRLANALPPSVDKVDETPADSADSAGASSASSASSTDEKSAAATPATSGSASSSAADPDEIKIEIDDDAPAAGALDVQPRIVIYNLENRPQWVGGTPVRDGDLHQTAVRSGPFHMQRDAHKALDEALQKAVNDYIDEWLSVDDAHLLLTYDLAYIKAHLLQPIGDGSKDRQYDEVAEHPLPIGLMHESHALLAFDDGFRQEVDQRWRQIVAGKRLLQTGLGAFGLLGLLGVLFGYFKADTATRGFYTRRLQIVAATAILALVAAGVLMAKWVPYM